MTLALTIKSGIFVTGMTTLAAHVIRSPIGPLGAAAFGECFFGMTLLLKEYGYPLLCPNNRQASTAMKVAIVVIGSLLATWGLLTAMGFTLSLFHVIALSSTACVCGIIADTSLKVFMSAESTRKLRFWFDDFM